MTKNCYGPLYYWWDECEETVSIGEDLAIELMKKGNFVGKTYIDVMSSEYGIPVIDLTEKEVKDLEYEIIPVKDEELLEKVKGYSRWFNTFPLDNDTKKEDFDNFIYIIRDDPTYSDSNKTYTTTTIIIDKKESIPIIINIKHPIGMERDGLKLGEYYKKEKMLIRTLCNKKLD